LNFAGNDYLGLSRDPRLAEAAHRAAVQHGISATSSRWGLGWTEIHEQLELALADFLSSEASCLLGQAFLGGLAYFSVMADECDTVFCDAQSHANLLLGMKAAELRIHTYRHLDAGDLARQLNAWTGPPPIIATDTVFGISGELAPLADLRGLARKHAAELLLDDAHGLFAMGPNGRGASEVCGLSPGDATILGSMSKALGASGGFLAGRTELVERFRRSETSSASTPLPIPIAAACLEALRIVRDQPLLRDQLAQNANQMRFILARRGIQIVSSDTPILAMVLTDAAEAQSLSDHFLSRDLRIPYFKYPSDPRDNLLRSVARSCYSDDDMKRFADAVSSFSS
jgi:7-keto-8-aminopelargonate synthetase-like enzyme